MVGLGLDLRFPECVEDDGETRVRVWSLRMWAGPFVFLVQFNANDED